MTEKTVKDIRGELPMAVKGGTASKPIWTIGDEMYQYVKPVNAMGLDKDGKKVRLGKQVLAKYVASKTKAGADLVFVGVFKAVKVSEPAADTAAA